MIYDVETITSLAAVAQAEFGRLDVVVNNLGGSQPLPFLDTEPDFLTRSLFENLGAGHTLVKGGGPGHAGRRWRGHCQHFLGDGPDRRRGFLAYGTSKGAINQYTHLASKDLAPRIRINAIGVGSTATSALDTVLTDESLRTAMEQATPMRRIADPEEIAAAVLYPASDASAFVTGQVAVSTGASTSPTSSSACLTFDLPDGTRTAGSEEPPESNLYANVRVQAPSTIVRGPFGGTWGRRSVVDAVIAATEVQRRPGEIDDRYRWVALSNTTLGVLMVTINPSIVLIALPSIFRGIGLNPLPPATRATCCGC